MLRLRPHPFATARNRSQPSATVRNRPQPSATVRNRPREPRMVSRAYGKFCKSNTFGSLLEVAHVPFHRFAWQAAFCEMWWKLEVANLEVHHKTRRKTLILKLQSVKIGGSLARNARFDAPTSRVSSLWFSCGLAVSMGEAAKPLLFEGFQAGCHVVLRGRRGTLWHSNLFDNVSKVVFCGTRNTFASFSQDELQFSWQAQHFRDLCHHFAWQAQHSTLLQPLHFTLQALHSTLSPLHSTLYTLHSTLYTPHFTLHTLHSTLYTLHFTLQTALHTLRFTLHTFHFTLYAPHSTLHTLHFTLHTLHSILYTPDSTLYTPHLACHLLPYSTVYGALVW